MDIPVLKICRDIGIVRKMDIHFSEKWTLDIGLFEKWTMDTGPPLPGPYSFVKRPVEWDNDLTANLVYS